MSSWVSPSMARFNNRATASHDDAHNAPPPQSSLEFEQVSLGSSSVLKPLTPPNVLNLTPSTCLAVSEFRTLLRQYRALDDGITTRLNRSFARSRDLGQSASPSLLSGGGKVTSSSSMDLGTSTYANAAPGACAAFWRELVDVWIGREEVVKFCVRVVDEKSAATLPPTIPTTSMTDDSRLDADIYRSTRTPPPTQRRSGYPIDEMDDVGRSGSRSENTAQVLRRQLHNELAIESIIRARSLDAFKSRCKFFTPTPPAGPQGDRERAMWQGTPTPFAYEATK